MYFFNQNTYNISFQNMWLPSEKKTENQMASNAEGIYKSLKIKIITLVYEINDP